MSTIIQIKRSANVAAPSTSDLLEAELAYSQDASNDGVGAKLYIESVDSGSNPVIHAIGGKYYTDAVDGATSANTANKIVKRSANGYVAVTTLVADQVYGNITGTISGQAASAVVATTANALTTARNITLVGDVTGTVSFDGSQDISITTTANVNSVALGTDTTGDYVSNVLAGTGISISGQGGETATPTVTLASSGVTANTYGGSSKIPVLTVDQYGRITSAANVSVAGVSTFAASGNTFTITTSDGGTYSASIQENSVRLGTDTTGNYLSNVVPGTGLTGTNFGTEGATPTLSLATSGVSAATYGGATSVPVYTVDATGRLTSAANVSIAIPASALTTDVALGSGTSGAYVANLVAGTGVTLSNLGNEGTTPTIAIGQSVATSADVTFNTITTASTANINGTTLTGGGSGFFVDPIAAGTTSNVIYFNASTKELTYGAPASSSFTIKGTSGTDTFNTGDTMFIVGGTGISTAVTDNTITVTNTGVTGLSSGGYGISVSGATGSVSVTNTGVTRAIAGTGISLDTNNGNVTFTNSGVTGLTGTSNEIEVSSSTGSVTIGLPNDVTIGNNLTVTGNLFVNGVVTTLDTAKLTVEDPLVRFGNANPADSLDIGFFGTYTSSGTKYAGLFRDASDSGKFKLFTGLEGDPDTTPNLVDTSGTGYTVATLVASLTGGTVSGLSANIAVSDGGTGRGTLTTNAVLFGQGTSAVGLVTGSAGQVLQLNGSGVPAFGGIDGGTY